MKQSEFATPKQLEWLLIIVGVAVVVILILRNVGSNVPSGSNTSAASLSLFDKLAFNLFPQANMAATPGTAPGTTPEGINTGGSLIPLIPGITLPNLPLTISDIPGMSGQNCDCMGY